MLATFVIFLREGVEASMIVAILLAYLNRVGARRYFRDVFLGVGLGLTLAAVGGTVAYLTIRDYAGSRVQTIFETVTYVLAAAVLTYMTFWMRNHARTLSADLKARTDAAMDRGSRSGMVLLAAQAVGREGVETVVFTLAILFAGSARGALVGAVSGFVVSMAVAVSIYRLGHRINIGRFFTVVGGLLMVFAAGLLADAVQNMQGLGWLPLLRHPLWHTASLLPEGSALGDVAHVFLGYAQSPSVLQAAVYVLYLAIGLVAFLRLGRALGRRWGRDRKAAAGV